MPIAQIHLHVDGEGYLRFARGSQAVYSADANLSTTSGILASQDGYPLLPQIHVPTDGAGLRVDMDGTVTVSGRAVGRIVLASFGAAPLRQIGGYFTGSGRSSIGYPGEGVFGVIRSLHATKAAPAQTRNYGSSNEMTIEVRLHTDLDKPHILLGDIADMTGSSAQRSMVSEIDLGATPILGGQRGITRTYILATLRSQGINTDHINVVCPVGSTVARKSQKISEDTLIAAAIDGARTKLGLDAPMRCPRDVADVVAPAGEYQITARSAAPASDGATVELEIDVDGQPVAHRTVTLVPSVAVPEIHSGEPLKVRLMKDGAIVTVSGKARSGARIGGTISVETDTGATFTGLLTSPSTVEVKLCSIDSQLGLFSWRPPPSLVPRTKDP